MANGAGVAVVTYQDAGPIVQLDHLKNNNLQFLIVCLKESIRKLKFTVPNGPVDVPGALKG